MRIFILDILSAQYYCDSVKCRRITTEPWRNVPLIATQVLFTMSSERYWLSRSSIWLFDINWKM